MNQTTDNDERELLASGRPVQIFHIGSVGQMNPSATTVTNNYYGDQFVPQDQKPDAEAPAPMASPQPDVELFRFIHPSVTDDGQRLQIHREVQLLVRSQPLPDICAYLAAMEKQARILLPMAQQRAIQELQRMGMPKEDVEGFTYKNFSKYYPK